MNNRYHVLVGVIGLLANIVTLGVAYGDHNKTVLTTSDNSPTYPTSGPTANSEVVIPTGGTIANPTVTVHAILTTTCSDGGKVTMSYTPSAGVTMDNGYPQGANTSTEIAKFHFDPAKTIGVVNTIQVSVVTHFSSSGVSCNAGGQGSIAYKICIPELTAGFSKANIPQGAPFCGVDYFIQLNIIGLDDFSQIQFIQTMNNTTNQTTYLGVAAPYTSPAGNISDNSGGWVGDYSAGKWTQPTVSKKDWKYNGNTASVLDHHRTGVGYFDSVTIGAGLFSAGTTYDYVNIFSHTGEFQDDIRRNVDQVPLFFDFQWCDGWDNKNLLGGVGTQPTVAQVQTAQPTYTTFAAGGVQPPAGGSGPNTGEAIYPANFPNTLNPPIPANE